MSNFRTVEISDPRFEVDHLRFITVKTPHLKGRGDLCVFVPPDLLPDAAVPMVILLHGVYGSAWAWAYGSGVHRQALKMIQSGEIPPMLIAMPSDGLWGDGSGYLPQVEGYNFEAWIARDVPAVLMETIPGARPESPQFISGLSMGGFGALRIGAKYGRQFSGISAHSAITALPQMKLFVEEELAHYAQANPVDEDVWATFQHYRSQLPPIRFDCGTSDQLLEYNRQLHHQMLEQGIPHEYQENPGSHEWAYWEKYVGESLHFFARQLLSR